MYNENPQKKPNLILIIFIIFQIILIIALAFSLPKILQNDQINEGNSESQPKVSVNNLSSEDTNLRSENVSNIERTLLSVAEKSNLNIDTTAGAYVVSDTVKTKYFERQDIKYFTGTVALSNSNLSYQIYYAYSGTENEAPNDNIVILCSSDSSDCKNAYTIEDRNSLIFKLLNYGSDAFNTFSLDLADKNFKRIGINLINDTEAEREDSIKSVKTAVEELGVSSDAFEYHINTQADLNYRINP